MALELLHDPFLILQGVEPVAITRVLRAPRRRDTSGQAMAENPMTDQFIRPHIQFLTYIKTTFLFSALDGAGN
ncbi:MAG: hypothetical protein ACSHW1_01785 [Yoonia sp.]|uniref:hypothetical protein n=1 Tax=Yoonia sp. TaxID=2212373 RepID=UPI003EF0E4B9